MVNSAVRDETCRFKKSVVVDVGGGNSKGVDLHMEGGQNKASLCGPYSSDKLVPATSSNWERGRGGEVIWSLYATADERNRQQPEMKPGRCSTPTQSKGTLKVLGLRYQSTSAASVKHPIRIKKKYLTLLLL